VTRAGARGSTWIATAGDHGWTFQVDVIGWAIEFAERQITINVVAPAPTETPMLVDPARVATPPTLPRLGRYIQPREIADLVAFLFGPSGRSITGQRMVVCAGASL